MNQSPLSQSALEERLGARLLASGLSLESFRDEGGAVPALLAPNRLEALVVLSDFDPAAYARGALALVRGLEPELRREWHRKFTRTIFLAGNPASLMGRFSFDVTAEDRSIAWLRPAPRRGHENLKRLLKPLRTAGPLRIDRPSRLEAHGPRRRRLRLATEGVALEHYLIHLNHALCESAIEGHLSAEDSLSITHEPRIDAPIRKSLYWRIHRDLADPSRLRAYAALEEDG